VPVLETFEVILRGLLSEISPDCRNNDKPVLRCKSNANCKTFVFVSLRSPLAIISKGPQRTHSLAIVNVIDVRLGDTSEHIGKSGLIPGTRPCIVADRLIPFKSQSVFQSTH
jgi:hypothetical protein